MKKQIRSFQSLSFFLFISFVLGAGLRFLWLTDIEFKGDEQHMYAASQSEDPVQAFPALGMPSGAKARNPGISIWVFSFPAKLFGMRTPEAVATLPVFSLLFSILLILWFVRREIPPAERNAWYEASALILVNPLMYFYSRKIWAQCVLPLFSVIFLWSWWKRKHILGAFCWGLLSAILGQIHMSGFFLAPVLFGWSLWKERREIPWGSFALGLGIGVIPLLPWANYVIDIFLSADPGQGTALRLGRPFSAAFLVQWLSFPAGLGLTENFGQNFRSFMQYPYVLGRPTYLSFGVHLLAMGLALSFYLPWMYSWFRHWRGNVKTMGGESPTVLYLFLSGIIYGALLTFTGLKVHRHYLIILFPMLWVWLCRIALSQKKGLVRLRALWCCQLLITLFAIFYVHYEGGAPLGDYGLPLRLQRNP